MPPRCCRHICSFSNSCNVSSITFANNRALGAGTGAGFVCSDHDFCEAITVVNNTVQGNPHPWGCSFVDTFTVSGNSPPGLEACMEHSMNRTTK